MLSELKGEGALDVLGDLIPPMTNIAMDPEAAKLFKREPLPEGMSASTFGFRWLAQASDSVLKKHKKDCIAMLAAATGVSPKQYSKDVTLEKLVLDLSNLMADPVFQSLFFSAVQINNLSGSVPVNTEAPET